MAKKRTIKYLETHLLYEVEYVDSGSILNERYFIVKDLKEILDELKDCTIYNIRFLHSKANGVVAIF